MQSLEATAALISGVNLDTEYLAYKNDQFYKVLEIGYVWRQRHGQTDCDYQFVAGKLKEFLETYDGEKKAKIISQMEKLFELAQKKDQQKTPVKKDQIKSAEKPLGEKKDEEIKKEANLPSAPLSLPSVKEFDTSYKLLDKLWSLTERTKSYLPYLPKDTRSTPSRNIFCPQKTNIKLMGYPEADHGYIHANAVQLGEGLNFIATIYPYTQVLFWAMAMQVGNVIVDVTNQNDITGRGLKMYYPQNINETCLFKGHFSIKCLSAEPLAKKVTKYQLEVVDLKTGKRQTIERIHYIGWEDVCGTNEHEFKDLVLCLQPYLGKDKVPIMHCVGGVGRTGTALTGLAIKSFIDKGIIVTKEDLYKHMQDLILSGRAQRGPQYVQTSTQIDSIWKLGQLLLQEKPKQ